MAACATPEPGDLFCSRAFEDPLLHFVEVSFSDEIGFQDAHHPGSFSFQVDLFQVLVHETAYVL